MTRIGRCTTCQQTRRLLRTDKCELCGGAPDHRPEWVRRAQENRLPARITRMAA